MNDWRNALLATVSLLAVTVMWFVPPIPQDALYHGFADQRALLGVPNFWNVASNLPFLLAAWLGFARLRTLSRPVPGRAYTVLCLGVLLVTFGSAWYHYSPGNASLVWDRLPMTIAFMALMSLMISDRISPRGGLLALWPLLLLGAGSVAWWAWTEQAGAGDLRPYVLVQFLPLLLIPLMLWLYPPRFTCAHRLIAALGMYVLAKLAEMFDAAIYDVLGWISGHSIKHLLAALGAWFILRAVRPGSTA